MLRSDIPVNVEELRNRSLDKWYPFGIVDAISAVFALPGKYRNKMRTPNEIERFNEEIRRRDCAIRIYPSDNSVMRIIDTVAFDKTRSAVQTDCTLI